MNIPCLSDSCSTRRAATRQGSVTFCLCAFVWFHISSVSAQTASTPGPQGSPWRVETEPHPGGTGNDRHYLTNPANESFQQAGRDIVASLFVRCEHVAARPRRKPVLALALYVQFSETVSVSQERVALRIDGRPIDDFTGEFTMDGKRVPIPIVDDMKAGSGLVVDIILPWAGRVALDFDIDGMAAAFSKLPCKNPKALARNPY